MESGYLESDVSEPGGNTEKFCEKSHDPLTYHTGENIFGSTDLYIAGLDGMSHSRYFVADPATQDTTLGIFGPGWKNETPRLIERLGKVILVYGSRYARTWIRNGSTFTPEYFYKETLTESGDFMFVRDEDGNVNAFVKTTYAAIPEWRGKAWSLQNAAVSDGATDYNESFHTWNSTGGPPNFTGTLASKSQYFWASGVNQGGAFFSYTYFPSGQFTSQLDQVNMYRVAFGGGLTLIRMAKYYYYTSSTSLGPATSLARVEILDPNVVFERKNYRYTTILGQVMLTMALEGPAYERALTAFGSQASIDLQTNATLATYGAKTFTYDAGTGRMIEQRLPGDGTYAYSLPSTSGFADGINNWKRKVTETLPDGGVNIVYTSYAGQALFRIHKPTAVSTSEWKTYYQYDAAGRLVMEASTEAITGYSESLPALVGTAGSDLTHVSNSAGLIKWTEYAATTTATTSTPGDVAGYVKKRRVSNGETAAKDTLEAYTYIRHDSLFFGATTSVYAIAAVTRYESGGEGNGQTTSFFYTWRTPTGGGVSNQILSTQTTSPFLETFENGPDDSTYRTQFFDQWERPTWLKDEDGFIHVTRYDTPTGAVTQRIVDVHTPTTTDEPSGWVTPPGGGFHLSTLYVFNNLGDTTQAIESNNWVTIYAHNYAAHEVRTYPGWTGSATTGPTQVQRQDWARSYTESFTMSAAPSVPPGTEAISNLWSMRRDFVDTQGRASQSDSYHNLTGLTYTQSTSFGTLGANFYREIYGYDVKSRRDRHVSWDGTIRRTVYDTRDRVTSEWIGTDDTPTSGTWSPTNLAGTNTIKTGENEYDGNGVGNDKLTKSKFMLSASTSLDTSYQYDYRNRQTDSRTPTNVATKRTYDNLDQVTIEETYASSDFTYAAAELRAKRETRFDNKRQVYQTVVHNVNPTTGALGNRLRTNFWSNGRGVHVKVKGPNGEFQKTQYDGAGRVKASYVCYDDTEFNSDYPSALDVVDDTVISQSVPSYDAGSNVMQTTRYERTNSASVTGDLSSGWTEANSRRTYTAAWFDLAKRMTDFADYGRNGGATFTRPGTAPGVPASDTSYGYIIVKYQFDSGGRQYRVTDNKGRITERTFDHLARATKSVENYVNGTPTETELDTDRTTETVFDTSGRLSQEKAHNPKGSGAGVEIQTTTYVYGTDANQATPAVWRNDVLVAEIYPDSDDTYTPGNPAGSKLGNGTDATYDRVEYTYDYSSRKLTWKLPLTTLHTYNYDSVGRLLSDVATTLGSGVNGAVRRIEYGYDDLSRALTVSSYSATSGGTLRNQVRYSYDGWGNEQTCEQGHEGTATGAPSFQKAFADGAVSGEAKYVRHSHSYYPNGRVVYRNYPAAGTVGDKLSRVDNVANDASGTLKFAQMTYLGIGSVVKIARPQVSGGLNLDLGIGTGNPAGWDDFGRVDDQKWQSDAAVIKDRYQYAYDRTGSRMFRDNLTATLKDHYFFRNGLDQVSTAKQGDLNAGRTDITGTPGFQEDWTLESHGNWRGLVQTASGTATLNQTRTHTKANEVTTIAATVGTNWGDGVVNRNGFMTRVPKPGSEGTRWRLTQDAWGRVFSVVDDVTPNPTIAEYKYDGLHRRTVKLKPNGANWDRRDYYYTCEWQVVEERELLNTASKTTVATVPKFQWVWGIAYIDEVVLRDENKDGDGDCVDGTDQRLYTCQDANFNVTALVDTAGTVVERVLYDAYGKHALWNAAWSATQSSTLYNNEVLYAGYRVNQESGLYQVRNRDYHATLGRWVQRDPIGYQDGMNLYEYSSSAPVSRRDPSGLQAGSDPKPDDYPVNPGGAFDAATFVEFSYSGVHTMADASIDCFCANMGESNAFWACRAVWKNPKVWCEVDLTRSYQRTATTLRDNPDLYKHELGHIRICEIAARVLETFLKADVGHGDAPAKKQARIRAYNSLRDKTTADMTTINTMKDQMQAKYDELTRDNRGTIGGGTAEDWQFLYNHHLFSLPKIGQLPRLPPYPR